MSLKVYLPTKYIGDKCPSCGSGFFVAKKSKFFSHRGNRKGFLACSNYPACKYLVSGQQAIMHKRKQ